MTKKRKVEFRDIRVEPKRSITRSQSFGTIVADYAKCTLIPSTNMCTFTFFQSHPIPKATSEGIVLDSIEEEITLEIKMPLNTALGLALYMNSAKDEIRKDRSKIHFGPVSIEKVKRDEKTSDKV